jgi:hypothetical protein
MQTAGKHGLVIALALAAVACGDETADRPCDPFMTRAQQITLGEIVAVGRDAEGTLFVVDRPGAESERRVFVSDGDVLVPRSVNGTGEASDGEIERLLFSVDDGVVPFRLVVEINAGETRMAIAPLSEERDVAIDALGSDAEHLEVLDETAVAGMPIRSVPQDIAVEYVAQTEDGALLVVVRPGEDADYEDFRLFLGPEQRLEQREVTAFERQRDGGSTHIEFRLDGKAADAFFPIMFTNDRFEPGPATLTVAGRTTALTRLDVSDIPDNAEFICF